VAVDLANAGPERDNALKKLDDVLNEMQVSVLGASRARDGSGNKRLGLTFSVLLVTVNNAGASHEMPVPFAESSMDEAETIIQVVSRIDQPCLIFRTELLISHDF
jgi:hypothetical protein